MHKHMPLPLQEQPFNVFDIMLFLDVACVCVHSLGQLHILSSLRDIISFQAYALRVNFIYQLKQRNIFITVGDDEEFTPLIK